MEDGKRLNGTSIVFEDGYDGLSFLKELDFGDDVRFEHLSVEAFYSMIDQKDDKEEDESIASRKLTRFGYKEPTVALVSSVYTCFIISCFCPLINLVAVS